MSVQSGSLQRKGAKHEMTFYVIFLCRATQATSYLLIVGQMNGLLAIFKRCNAKRFSQILGSNNTVGHDDKLQLLSERNDGVLTIGDSSNNRRCDDLIRCCATGTRYQVLGI